MTSPEDETVRVLLVDDHPMFRDGLRVALSTLPGIDIIADVATGTQAVDAAREHQPDVVLMDVNMPDLNGIEATRRIVGESPHVAVLILTMFDEDENVFQAMRAGARGYLLKEADQADIVHAVRAVGRGNAVFGPALAKRLISYFAAGRDAALPFTGLTDREREVLELIAQGRNNPEIARELGLTVKTVRNHVSNIFAKLQVGDRAHAIVRAREAGLGRAAGRTD